MRVFGAIRVSTKVQRDGEGEAEQKAGIQECISAIEQFKGYDVVFKPYVQSTTFVRNLDERKDLLDIRDSLQEGDVLAFWNIKRFSRNYAPAVTFITNIKEDKRIQYIVIGSRVYNLSVVDDEENLITDLAKIYRVSWWEHKERYDGKMRCLKKGYFIGGIANYGWDTQRVRVGDKWRTIYVIVEEEAKVVVWIFNLYCQGKSSTDITIELNKQGIKSSKGGRWQSCQVQRMIKNKKYMGVKAQDGSWIMPQIIDEATFQKTQEFRVKNAKRGKSAKSKYIIPLNHQLECGCGQKIYYHKNVSRGKPGKDIFFCAHHFYRDKSEKGQYPKCPMYIEAKELIDFVWSKIVPMLIEPNRLRQILSAYLESCFVGRTEIELDAVDKKKEIKKIELREERLKYLFELGDLSKEQYGERKRPLTGQKLHLEDEVRLIESKLFQETKLDKKVVEIEHLLSMVDDEIKNASWEDKSWWLSLLVEKVILTYTPQGYEVMIYGAVDEVLEGYSDYLKEKNNGDNFSELHRSSIHWR